MPPLENPQTEHSSQARARVATLFAARIASLRAERDQAEHSRLKMILDALVRMARDSEALKTPAGMKDARLDLPEADRLRTALTRCNNSIRYQIDKEPAA